jgi:hypothetical protein
MVPTAAIGTPTTQQGGNFMVSVAGTAVGSVSHQIDLKVTQLPGGQLSQVSGFIVSPEDVVQVKQRENLIVSTSPDLKTHQVTVINMQGIPIDLVPLPSNVWSLQGLLPGVYTLNVNVAMSSSGILGTYETILVILQPDQQPLPPTTIINQVTNQITIRPPPPSNGCAGNLTLIDGKCTKPCPPGTTGTPPNCEPICPEGEDCPCPEGTTGTPPNCEPIIPPPDCDVDDPPEECVPTECPDGRIMPPGEQCPDDALPCDVPDPPEGCSVPTECPDGSIIPPGEQCPPENGGDNKVDEGNGGEDEGNGGEDEGNGGEDEGNGGEDEGNGGEDEGEGSTEEGTELGN